MARTAVRQADPDEIVALADAVLPALVESLPKPQLAAFIRHLFNQHLATLLQDFDAAERAALLEAVLPAIAEQFPLQDSDLSAAVLETLDP